MKQPLKNVVLGVSCLVLASQTAEAQTRFARVGDHIRFTVADRPLPVTGELLAVGPDSVAYLEDCSACVRREIARKGIQDLAIQLPTTGRARHSLGGFFVGALSGALAGFAAGAYEARDCHDGPCGIGIIIFTPIAAGAGAVLGSVIGWFSTPEQWMTVELPKV